MPKLTRETFLKPVLGIMISSLCVGTIAMMERCKRLSENNDELKKYLTIVEIMHGVVLIFGVFMFGRGVFGVYTDLQEEPEPEVAPLLNSDASTQEETQDYSSLLGDDNFRIDGFGF